MRKPPHFPPESTDTDWASVIATTQKLGQPKAPTTPLKPLALAPLSPPPTSVTGWADHPPFPIHSRTASCLSGCVDDLDPARFKQLQRGEIRPTDVLDLHGFTSPDAWRTTVDFLHESFNHDHTCVLIISGKGRGSGPEGDMGAVKYQLPGWLAGHPRVRAFYTALPADGGTGAVYVLLQRHKLKHTSPPTR